MSTVSRHWLQVSRSEIHSLRMPHALCGINAYARFIREREPRFIASVRGPGVQAHTASRPVESCSPNTKLLTLRLKIRYVKGRHDRGRPAVAR